MSDSEAAELFAEVQKRDKIKKQWCRDNNVPLLIIPYWEYDQVEEKITDFLALRRCTVSETEKKLAC